MTVETKKLNLMLKKNGTLMNVIYILLIFSGGEYKYMCTNIMYV